MKTLKHFAKFIALSMRGRVKKDNPHGRPTVDSVRNQMRKFCSAWNRDNVDKGQRIPEEMSLSMAPVRFLLCGRYVLALTGFTVH